MQEQALPYLKEILLFLGLAGILIPLLQRFRINPILGFLAAGTVLGPFGIGLWAREFPWLTYLTVRHAEGVASLAELGVMFLMFMIGLELSVGRLWQLRRWVFGAGMAQVCISAAVIALIAHFFENRTEVSLLIGFMLALSSTAVVMQLMSEQGSAGSKLGQAGFSILMFQDLAVVPILIWIGMAGHGEGQALLPLVGITILKSVGAILLIYLVGGRVLRPLFRYMVAKHRPDIFMALTLLSLIGIAATTNAAGLSTALGAFLAGLLLAETEFKHEVEVTVEPFRGLLMGVFFMSIGMQIDVREVAQSPVWIPLSVAGLFIIKTVVTGALLRIGNFNWGRSVEGGLLLGQGGEFAFIAVGYALTAKLLEPQTGQFIMLVVGLSMFATPVIAKFAHALGETWEQRVGKHVADSGLQEAKPMSGHIVIAGFGRVGQLLAHILDEKNIRYVALENDTHLVTTLHAQGVPIYFGDADKQALLEKLQAGRAAAIVLTMDNSASVLHAVRAIRRNYPDVPLFARCKDEQHALALTQAGATLVIPEILEVGLQLSSTVLDILQVNQREIAETIQAERERRTVLMQDNTPN